MDDPFVKGLKTVQNWDSILQNQIPDDIDGPIRDGHSFDIIDNSFEVLRNRLKGHIMTKLIVCHDFLKFRI